MPRPRNDKPHLEWRRGSWSVQFWEGGTRRRLATGTAHEPSAKQFLADFEAQLERSPLKLTVADALDRYERHREGKIQAPERLREAAKALKRDLGDLRVDQIGQTAWDRFAAARVTQPNRRVKPEDHKPRKVSDGTLRREFNVLRATLRRAWKDGYLVKPPELEPPRDSAARGRYLTRQEAEAIIAACDIQHVKVFITVAMCSGARKGSILALTWDRVDFATRMIDFQEPGRKLTAKRRAIAPMNNTALRVLTEAKAIAQTDFVVEYAGRQVKTGLRWSWARLCRKAGLTWTPKPHHIKHSVVSWLAMAGIPIGQAADLTATDEATLRRIYRKFDPTYLRPVAAVLDFDGPTGPLPFPKDAKNVA